MYLRNVVGALSFVTSASAACTRELLKNVTDQYITAQTRGSSSDLASLTASNFTYTENEVKMTLDRSVLTERIIIDHDRSIFDTVQCATFTELIAATNIHQYVIGTRMEINSNSKISKIESVVTDRGDWAFNATGYRYWDSLESWDPIPVEKQDSREVIQAAGDAYFDRFKNESIVIPFGIPCSRLEGGVSTAPLNLTGDSCTAAGLPSTLVVTNRRYVVDQEMGAVDIFLGFPGLDRSRGMDTMPDSHVFRVESGKIRYIHTVSLCVESGCGMDGAGPPQKVRSLPAFWRPRRPLRFDMAVRRDGGY
ncbi:hypothetical protein F5B22DRAFT_374736 [Xylaria bambusicola]|uniref:uncharacterized protein n=1 Tax=Xylaria bambusicola TaxID=326684 RepID=UPI0020089717|nr:uncharacterized protein F5B22DRAFT_374736 [Xylaria bambusicola]KAI0508946.1 hypothetical protein F5B22DRAFT_374736 [Xylaria bambusicola]